MDSDTVSETESIDIEMSEIPHRLSLREQEIRYIETYGLVAFCHGTIVTAILQDADYLRGQLTYLGK